MPHDHRQGGQWLCQECSAQEPQCEKGQAGFRTVREEDGDPGRAPDLSEYITGTKVPAPHPPDVFSGQDASSQVRERYGPDQVGDR